MANYMARIWARRLEAGTQEWANCPTRYKEQTKAVLLRDVADNIISKDRYKEITGEDFE